MHIYDYTDKTDPFLSSTDKISKIKDNINLYPSVTTVLNYYPNKWLEDWKLNKFVELAKENPDADMSDIKEMAWGYVTVPWSGEVLTSSDFGTKGHEAIDSIINQTNDPTDDWTIFVSKVVDEIFSQGLFPIMTEYLSCCHDMRIAGRIDLIAKSTDDKYVLLDYKFRRLGKTKKPKFYDKDCAQLALEAEFVQQEYHLDYVPKICSVCIDIEDGEPFFKWWSDKKFNKCVNLAYIARDMFFLDNNIPL